MIGAGGLRCVGFGGRPSSNRGLVEGQSAGRTLAQVEGRHVVDPPADLLPDDEPEDVDDEELSQGGSSGGSIGSHITTTVTIAVALSPLLSVIV